MADKQNTSSPARANANHHGRARRAGESSEVIIGSANLASPLDDEDSGAMVADIKGGGLIEASNPFGTRARLPWPFPLSRTYAQNGKL